MYSLLSILALILLVSPVHSNVIGIDFATDALKVAIVQPGTPLEIGKKFLFYCFTPLFKYIFIIYIFFIFS